ncbi:MAG: ABC transporter ATP-binding protein [Candidatus Altiarchaeota archaeon]|nr:ABC transporter ATP-binding protein [Candidatus Altiarchaeota archaeon]
MGKKEIVRLRDVSVAFEGVSVLEDVNLSIYDREFLGIIGPNGGGKTTLLKVILGFIKPDKGTVEVFGRTPEEGRRHIGYVPQHSRIDIHFPASVSDVVLMGRYAKKGLLRHYDKKDRAKALSALERVGMADLKDRHIGKLSGGQRQRVLIARALVSEPGLLLMDEPISSVDKTVEAGLYEFLEELKERISVVMVSHDISAVSVHVDKIACLNRRLYYHDSKELSQEALEEAYQCPIDMIAHGVPHRVLRDHEHGGPD